MTLRTVSALCLVLVLSAPALAGERGGRAEYIGGTVSSVAANADGNIHTTDEHSFLFRAKQVRVQVPYDKINLLEYGQRVNRRYGMAILVSPILLLSKKRAHFLTVGFSDEQGRQQAMVFRLEKNDVRFVLAALEAKTGRKVQFQDEEARKAGRG